MSEASLIHDVGGKIQIWAKPTTIDSEKYLASVKHHDHIRGYGRSASEALGELIRTYPEHFKIVFDDLQRRSEPA